MSSERSSSLGSEYQAAAATVDDDVDSVRSRPLPRSFATDTLSGTGSSAQLKDLFPEDPQVVEATHRIRRILYRRRAQETANWGSARRFLHTTFYEPSSMRARAYMAFSTSVVLLFLIVFMIDTFPQYRILAHWRKIADTVNLSTAAYFALEWVLRFYAFRRPSRYLLEPMTIIDLLGVVPGFIYYTSDSVSSFGRVKWLRALQVLRVLRLLRLTEYSIELYVTVRTLKRSAGQILIVMMVIVSLLLTACFLLFFAENDSLDVANVQWLRIAHGTPEVSPFQNVFFCLYWGFVTITTVGYGDYTPVSPWGQVIACLTMLMGVFTIVFPTSIISNNFATEWAAFRKAQQLHEQRKLQREFERRRRGLVKAWSYATHTYDDTTNNNNVDTQVYEGDELEKSREEPPVATQVHYEDQQLPYQPPRSRISIYSDGQDISDITDPESMKMGPQEYGRIVDVGKKIENDLGIPGASIDDINSETNVNKNLAVSAMYSKLYNDAFTSLCERMLGRMIEYNGLGSTEEVVEFIQRQPSTTNFVRSWPHDKKLSVLEHKLLCYVLDRVKTRHGGYYQDEDSSSMAAFQGNLPHHSKHGGAFRSQSLGHGQPGIHRFSGSASYSVHHMSDIRQRIRSRFKHMYDNTPLSSNGSSAQSSLHDYITSGGSLKQHGSSTFAPQDCQTQQQQQQQQLRTAKPIDLSQDDDQARRNATVSDSNARLPRKEEASSEDPPPLPPPRSPEIVIEMPSSESENSDSTDSKELD